MIVNIKNAKIVSDIEYISPKQYPSLKVGNVRFNVHFNGYRYHVLAFNCRRNDVCNRLSKQKHIANIIKNNLKRGDTCSFTADICRYIHRNTSGVNIEAFHLVMVPGSLIF